MNMLFRGFTLADSGGSRRLLGGKTNLLLLDFSKALMEIEILITVHPLRNVLIIRSELSVLTCSMPH